MPPHCKKIAPELVTEGRIVAAGSLAGTTQGLVSVETRQGSASSPVDGEFETAVSFEAAPGDDVFVRVPVGELRLLPTTYVPAGWLACAGQVLAVDQYADLKALVPALPRWRPCPSRRKNIQAVRST